MTKHLMVTTALAVLLATPAFAATETTAPATTATPNTLAKQPNTADVGTPSTGSISSDAQGVVDKVRDLTGTAADTTLNVDVRHTTNGIIGAKVHNTGGEQVATVEDILFDQDGHAAKIILANGGILGMGAKLVAVDFGLVYARGTDDAEMIVPLTEDTIKRMAAFSYDANDAKDGAQVIASGQLSAKAMLDGELLNDQGKEVASVDNLTIENGKASQVIVSYNTTLGMGGDKLAVAYDQLQKIGNTSEVDFKLPAALSSRFETTAKSASAK